MLTAPLTPPLRSLPVPANRSRLRSRAAVAARWGTSSPPATGLAARKLGRSAWATLESARATSITMSTTSRRLPPAPPSARGTPTSTIPASASARTSAKA